ncbi:hypothetical protein KT71_08972 [Congregibacter litoralis KT71]|uniref:Uncharacterized protein n=2 Tax=Congregibacter TaxID=393661 RepID=A4A4M5_9GAMM|nr:hypothetical protein KT71_08972 [Congregibacter litoralis KT71]
MKNPSDGNILDTIFKEYYAEFQQYEQTPNSRSSKIYVPIDCELLARRLRMDEHLLFGRLYYHLDQKYRYTQEDGSKVYLFAFKVGKDRHAVNFPLLAAVLAEHKLSFNRFMFPMAISCVALSVSIWAVLK